MSATLAKGDVLFFQRLMASAGLYKGALDGSYGATTAAAEAEFERLGLSYRNLYGSFDARSEGNIATLVPKAQVIARLFLRAAKDWKVGEVRVLSGTRTYAEQNTLYAQGRTARGQVVTKAKGGQSNHNFGIAWDVGVFVGGVYYTGATRGQELAYDALAAFAKSRSELKGSFEWGGDWTSIKDKPHYQLVSGKSVAQCRVLLEAGKPYV